MRPSPFPHGPRWSRYFRFWQRSVQRDIDDELHFHFDARIEELVAQGLSSEAARAQAFAEFGDVRDVRAGLRDIDSRVARRRNRAEVFDALRQDVVYAARSLRRTPVMSLTVIVTLALGLGVNAAMFSLLDVVFLRPPAAVVDPSGIKRIWGERRFTNGTQYWSGYDYQSYVSLSGALDSVVDLAIYRPAEKMALGAGESPPTANVTRASVAYFRLLGLRPLLGRFFVADEDALDGAQRVAVISESFWRRELEGDRAAIGQTIQLGTGRFTVIGVAPHRFTGIELDATDIWVPLATGFGGGEEPWYRNPNVNGFQIIIRRKPTGSVSTGELESRITATLRRQGVGYRRDTTTVGQLGSIVRANGPGKVATEVQVATRLGGVAIVVLLIACANVVNLLLARAVRRQREIAVRLALGISRGRLLRLLVTESVLLSLAAAVAAVGAAVWGGIALRKLLMPEIRWAESPLHWRVLLLALVGAVIAGVVAGLVPALQSRAPDLTNALKAGAREGGTHRSRLRSSLIVVQTALSVLLLVGAALFVRSLNNVRHKDIGYTVDRVAFVELRNGRLDAAAQNAQADRLLALRPRLAAIPGVEAVAYASVRPKYGISFVSFFPWADTAGRKRSAGIYTAVTPEFFAASGTKLLRGKIFSGGGGGPYSVVVNQALADESWPNEDPIGKCVYFEKLTAPCSTVIGVAQTAMLDEITEKPSPHVYVPLEHAAFDAGKAATVVLRFNPQRMTAALVEVRALLLAEFPNVYSRSTTMASAMEPEYRPWRLGAIVFSLFGVLALLVAAIGVYSTISYAVGQRTHEFGVRAALGATMGDVLRQVLGEGMRVVTIGVVVGVLLALAGGRLVAALLYGIAPTDPVAMTAAAAVLLVTAVAASLSPAWRAAKADPVTALRAE